MTGSVGVPSGIFVVPTHTFAYKADGQLYSWGNNALGSLGVGDSTNKPIPTLIQYPPNVQSFTEVHPTDEFTFVKGNDGKYYAWGRNTHGQLGMGNILHKETPTLVPLD